MRDNDLRALLDEWTDELKSTLSESNSFGIAIFTEMGGLLFSNATMSSLCADFDSSSLLNPVFEKLTSIISTDSLLFSGLVTIGKYNCVNTSIEAKVFRKGGKLLIAGGVNVLDLIDQNKTMHFLNQKITNLQRQLTQEKAELEHTMDELKETQQLLIQSEKMNAMGKLVAGVAHELNNPIAFVYSNLFSLEKYVAEIFETIRQIEKEVEQFGNPELLETITQLRKKNELNYLEEDISDMTKESKVGIERVKIIVEDLRRFSRLDESDIKQVDLIENIRSTESIVRAEIAQNNIHYHYVGPSQLQLECYPGQLNQAILNVLINAIDAVQPGGRISLIVTDESDKINIEVTDNGHGIQEDIKNRIFEPFFTTKPVGSGTGLGLSITYKIIHDLHKGTIEVESIFQQGTKIKLSIPKKI